MVSWLLEIEYGMPSGLCGTEENIQLKFLQNKCPINQFVNETIFDI